MDTTGGEKRGNHKDVVSYTVNRTVPIGKSDCEEPFKQSLEALTNTGNI